MRRFEYVAPASLADAVQALASQPQGSRPLAGGTDLVIHMKERGRRVPALVSLRNVREIDGLSEDAHGGLRIGAMTKAGDVAASPVVRQRYPGISDGADLVGSIQIRNRGTIGGNFCNAAPSADVVPPIVASGATLRVVGPDGERTVASEQFFVGPGNTVLKHGEILADINIPAAPAHTGSAYLRHVPRREMDIAVVGVAVQLTLNDAHDTITDARVVLASVAPTPIRAYGAEAALKGKAANEATLTAAGEAAASDARPITDVRGSDDYRRELLKVYTRRAAQIALDRASGVSNGRSH